MNHKDLELLADLVATKVMRRLLDGPLSLRSQEHKCEEKETKESMSIKVGRGGKSMSAETVASELLKRSKRKAKREKLRSSCAGNSRIKSNQ